MSATPTPSEASSGIVNRARALREARVAIIARPGLVGVPLRDALADAFDDWLRPAVPERPGVALVAVGGLGRREMAPYSDLDLMLLYDRSVKDVAAVADRIWYPIWDSRLGLDHSVRTVEQALAVASMDMKAMLSLLDLRHVAGDTGLAGELREKTLGQWRGSAAKRVDDLRELTQLRGRLAGEVAFALEPDLKQGRGGLRDWHALRALSMAQLVDVPDVVRSGSGLLLDVRGELQRVTGGPEDVLRLQEQTAVARALGMSSDDEVLRAVNGAGRSIAYALDRAWRQIPQARRGSRLRRRTQPNRQPVAHNIVSQDGEIVLALSADPLVDPVLPMRAARAAAERDEPLAPFALDRMVSETAPLLTPWPEAARTDFVALLGTGKAAVPVLEALDQAGLMTRWFPEWAHVRFAAQRNPVHRFTVERHLMEAAAEAAAFTREVRRPDLLLVAALFHDIGKALPGDHSVTGGLLAQEIAPRMGFSAADSTRVVALVRHHLLLAHTATRRDLADPATIRIVTDSLGEAIDILGELAALSRADAAATGPAAWSDWKGRLVDELVERVGATLAGERRPRIDTQLDASRRRMAAAGQLAVERVDELLLVAAPDAPGLLSVTSGVLALHSLDVRSAGVATEQGMAVNAFVAAPRFGSFPDVAALRNDLARALDGSLPLADRLRAKDAAYADRDGVAGPPAKVLWFDDEATDAVIVEIRAQDSFGLLHRLTGALESSRLDIRSAQISTLGGSAVDAFYVTAAGNHGIDPAQRAEASRRLAAAARGEAV
ncbi:MAG TPA: [protein-PII] uridylyltransferase [Jatrophihabitantaceae bacterium]|nr:[protein-PII] uridylyltransferase [Jatrophihabitantaceae bacterium]